MHAIIMAGKLYLHYELFKIDLTLFFDYKADLILYICMFSIQLSINHKYLFKLISLFFIDHKLNLII